MEFKGVLHMEMPQVIQKLGAIVQNASKKILVKVVSLCIIQHHAPKTQGIRGWRYGGSWSASRPPQFRLEWPLQYIHRAYGNTNANKELFSRATELSRGQNTFLWKAKINMTILCNDGIV
jgi:hypothetical protein